MRMFNIQNIFAVSALASSALFFAACTADNPIEIENDERDISSIEIDKKINKLEKEIQNVLASSSNSAGSSSSQASEEPKNYLTQNMLVSITLKSFDLKDTSKTRPNYRPSVRFAAQFSSDGVKSYRDKSGYIPDNADDFKWEDGKFSWEGNSNVVIPVSKGVDAIKLCVEVQNIALNEEDEDGEVYIGDDICVSRSDLGLIEKGKIFIVPISAEDNSFNMNFEWTLVPNI